MPKVSIIMGVYESAQTVARSLNALYAQTFTDFEILMMDSSASDDVERIVRNQFPDVIFRHSHSRLPSETARNQMAPLASGEIFVFTDPDIYPHPTWLESLVSAHHDSGQVLAGAINCYGDRWLDNAIHFCKFDMWLSSGHMREIAMGATSNMLCPRDIFEDLDGFPDAPVSGDTMFCWTLAQQGHSLLFVPEAIVEHHHLSSWKDLLKEQAYRGRMQAAIRPEWFGWTRTRIALQLLVSVVPIRLVRLLMRTAVNAWHAKQFGSFLLSLPVILSARMTWLLAESRSYFWTLLGNSPLETSHFRAPE